MAEGALRVLLEQQRSGEFVVKSAGVSAANGFPATMYAIEAAKIWSCDLSGHKSQMLSRTLIDEADLILGMTSEHVKEILRQVPDARNRTFLFKNFPDSRAKGEPVEDPIGQELEKYNATFLELGEYLGKYLKQIIQMIDEKIAR